MGQGCLDQTPAVRKAITADERWMERQDMSECLPGDAGNGFGQTGAQPELDVLNQNFFQGFTGLPLLHSSRNLLSSKLGADEWTVIT